MSNRDYTIDMRLRADFARAQREVDVTTNALSEMGNAGTDAGKALNEVASGAETSSRAMSGFARASTAVRDAVQQEIRLIAELQDRLERGASSWQELADTEAMLDRAMSKGLVTADEYNDALKNLDKSQASLARSSQAEQKALNGTVSRYDQAASKLARLESDERKLKVAVDAGTISRDQYNRAMDNIGAQRRALQSLNDQERATRRLAISQQELRGGVASAASQALRGDFGGAGTTLLGLTTRGAAGFGALSLAVAGSTAVLGAFLVAAYQGQESLNGIERSLLSAGNAAGTTAGSIQVMAGELGKADGRIGDAQKALQAMAASGLVVGDNLRLAGQGALDLSRLTGESIEVTTQKVLTLAKAPTEGMVELNKQYRFLTVEVAQHVRALEEQGRTTEAVTAILEQFGAVHRERVEQAEVQAGSLVRAWSRVKGAIAGAWEVMKSFGSTDVAVQLATLQKDLQVSLWSSDNRETERTRKLRQEIGKLQGELKGVEELATGDAFVASITQEAVDAANATSAALAKATGKSEKLADALADVAKRYRILRDDSERNNTDNPLLTGVVFKADGSISGGGYDKEVAALKKQFSERPGSRPRGRSPEQVAQDAAKQELQDLARRVTLLDQVAEGEDKVSEASRVAYEIENGKYKAASEAMKSQLLDAAQLYDSQKMLVDVSKQVATWQGEIYRLRGQPVPPELEEATRKLQAQKRALEDIGRTDEASKIGELLGLREASRQLADVRRQYDQVMAQIGWQSQQIQAEQQAGLITQAAAQQKIVDLYGSQLGVLRQLVPQMREAASALGSPEALDNVSQIEVKLQEMSATTNLLQQTFTNSFESGITASINSLVDGTTSLSDAVGTFFQTIAKGMVSYFAQDWAQQASGWVRSLMGSADGASPVSAAASAASITTGAASTAAGTITAGATTAAATMASGIGAAASGLVAAAATAASILAAQSASNSAQGVVSVGAAAAVSRANGGPVWGAGTGTSDSIPAWLSNGEFVTRAMIMQQPGALAFMHDFNSRGMAAVKRWGRFASGGQVATRKVATAIPDRAAQLAGSAPKNMRVYLLQDQDELVQKLASHPAFEQAVVMTASRNGAAIQSEW
ncbi:phage tail length tape measure family protein [Stenotrophomonas maltophilia]|nr:phage tail tape measure protein [Stenotrophomonas maltophilia]WQI22632.1 phage tail length tape measure family protein [Stenotrophomonas maltophilia]